MTTEGNDFIPARTWYFSETDMIREAIFMLKGLNGVVFVWDQDTTCFTYQAQLGIAHMTAEELEFFVVQLLQFGNSLNRIRLCVSQSESFPSAICQAFSVSLKKLLDDFSKELISLEKGIMDSQVNVLPLQTILSLSNWIKPRMLALEFIYLKLDRFECFEWSHGWTASHKTPAMLIDMMYDACSSLQEIQTLQTAKAMIILFLDTIEPLLFMTDNAVVGTAIDDVYTDYFIQSNVLDIRYDLDHENEDMYINCGKSCVDKCPAFLRKYAEKLLTAHKICLITKSVSVI